MRRVPVLAGACVAAGVWLAGCAQVGPVQPPSAYLPRPVGDFSAARRGPRVRLAWTPPDATSDGVAWRGLIRYHLCVWPGVERGRPRPPVRPSTAVPAQVPSPPPANVGADQTPGGAILPPCPHLLVLTAPEVSLAALGVPASAQFATLALFAVNADGQGAGWSNPAVVPLTPVAPPPQGLAAAPTADGIALQWRLPSPPPQALRLYRNGALLASLPGAATQYLDRSAVWNRHYEYFLRSAAGAGAAAVVSAASPLASVYAAAVAPPAPAGLEVVAAPAAGGVDLSWNPVSAADLAGYDVYRRRPGGGWQRRNGAPILTPVFHDVPAPAGTRYAVTAVSTSGAESPRSPSVALAPQL